MTVALRSSKNVGALILVDNAPVDATLNSDFGRYIQGMRKILDGGITQRAEADDIMKDYEKVGPSCSAKRSV